MKRSIRIAAPMLAALAMGAVAAPAAADVDIGISVGVPGVYARPAPVYVEPYPVYVQPAPVYVQPAPVYVYPHSHYRRPPPVYRAGHNPRWQAHSGWHGHSHPGHRGFGRRDLDRDGVPNYRDGDRDGDGVINRYDRRPNNGYRY